MTWVPDEPMSMPTLTSVTWSWIQSGFSSSGPVDVESIVVVVGFAVMHVGVVEAELVVRQAMASHLSAVSGKRHRAILGRTRAADTRRPGSVGAAFVRSPAPSSMAATRPREGRWAQNKSPGARPGLPLGLQCD